MGHQRAADDGLPDFREQAILYARDLRQIVMELRALRKRVSDLEDRFPRSNALPVTALRVSPAVLLLPSTGLVRYPYRVEEVGPAGRDLTAHAVVSSLERPGGRVNVKEGCLIPLHLGPAALRVQCEGLDVEVTVHVYDCGRDLSRSVCLYQDHRYQPIILTDQIAARARPPATTFVWKQDPKVSFPADDPGTGELEQRLSDNVLSTLQPSEGHLFAALILVRCLSQSSQLAVLAPGSELRSNREITIPSRDDSFLFDVALVVWEGRVTELRFVGPPIIGIVRVQL